MNINITLYAMFGNQSDRHLCFRKYNVGTMEEKASIVAQVYNKEKGDWEEYEFIIGPVDFHPESVRQALGMIT